MEELEMQKEQEEQEEQKEKVEKKDEEKPVEVKKEIPKGYHLPEVPTNFQRIIALGEEQVDADVLLVKIANALVNTGILK